MDILVVDRGASAHAVLNKIAASPDCDRLFTTLDNPGAAEVAEVLDIDMMNFGSLARFARKEKIGFTYVGADDPLAKGIVDHFQEDDFLICGPTAEQARIESDREHAKWEAEQLGIPVGPHAEFTAIAGAMRYAMGKERAWPLFAKLNILARGKGAKECNSPEELENQLREWRQSGQFSDNQPVVIEDFVVGEEASHHAFCDGKTHVSFPFLMRDHKTISKDSRDMTGGTGTVGPLPIYSQRDAENLGLQFVDPIVRELGFKGVLFSGLKGPKGKEKVLEWNAREGDPEMQLAMRRLKSDIVSILMACALGELDTLPTIKWEENGATVCLVMAAPGYPTNTQLGGVIEGIREAAKIPGVEVLHAGTKEVNGEIVITEGRALSVVAEGSDLAQALDIAYGATRLIHSDPELYVRQDIGQTALMGV